MAMRRRLTITAAIGGFLLVAAYATIAAVQILVLNPLAAAPGRTLDEIYADMAAANETMVIAPVIGVLAAGVVIAGAAAVTLIAMRNATPMSAATVFLVLLTLGAPAYFIASFGPGMSLADTYYISGADYAPWGGVLGVVSAVALIGAISLIAVSIVRIRRLPRVAA